MTDEYLDKYKILTLLKFVYVVTEKEDGTKTLKEVPMIPAVKVNEMKPAAVRKIIKGKWKYVPGSSGDNAGGWICSECSARNCNIETNPDVDPLVFTGSKFCPNCGAVMDINE